MSNLYARPSSAAITWSSELWHRWIETSEMWQRWCSTQRPIVIGSITGRPRSVSIRLFVWRKLMTTKLCACCGKAFQPRPQVPNQAYCSSPECQRARKRRWQQDKLQNDPDYRGNQRDAQRAWQERNPDYWRSYRDSHLEYAERNRSRQRPRPSNGQIADLAKMDVSALPSGLYQIRKLAASVPAQQDCWIVEITPVCLECPCKKDVCKERT